MTHEEEMGKLIDDSLENLVKAKEIKFKKDKEHKENTERQLYTTVHAITTLFLEDIEQSRPGNSVYLKDPQGEKISINSDLGRLIAKLAASKDSNFFLRDDEGYMYAYRAP